MSDHGSAPIEGPVEGPVEGPIEEEESIGFPERGPIGHEGLGEGRQEERPERLLKKRIIITPFLIDNGRYLSDIDDNKMTDITDWYREQLADWQGENLRIYNLEIFNNSTFIILEFEVNNDFSHEDFAMEVGLMIDIDDDGNYPLYGRYLVGPRHHYIVNLDS